MTDAVLQRVAVIGTGTIGASWAAYFLSRGVEVFAHDASSDAEGQLRHFVDLVWPTLEQVGLSQGADRNRLRYFPQLESALDGVEFVQESATEEQTAKTALFHRIDACVGPEVVIASSSSGLLMSDIQIGCNAPERCVIGHPFNPPHLIPLVEVVGGRMTTTATIEKAMALYRAIGKRPIHIQKEVVGHVANRLQAAVLREALHLLIEGVVSAADIDEAIVSGPGIRWANMGPLLTFHLGGGQGGIEHFLEHLTGALNRWMADLGQELITPEVARVVVEGVHDEVGSRAIADLERARDEFLVALLALKQGFSKPTLQ